MNDHTCNCTGRFNILCPISLYPQNPDLFDTTVWLSSILGRNWAQVLNRPVYEKNEKFTPFIVKQGQIVQRSEPEQQIYIFML